MVKQRQKNKHDAAYRKISKNSDESEEETELFTRNKPAKRQVPTIDKEIEENDTLQSLAIRYRCTIEDLKRLNNIHRENEIFAKRTIKVPHYPISMALAGVHLSGRSSPNDPEASTSNVDHNSLSTTLINLSNGAKEHEVNEIIFNSNIAQKSTAPPLVEFDDVDEEEIHLLPQADVPNDPIVLSKYKFNGADADISLKALILCIVILIFVLPLIYVFYIAEHPEQYQHHGS